MNERFANSSCAVIVAHPDDETLWSGGTILMNPANKWTIVSVCRQSDPDRNPRFFEAVKHLNAAGCMGDMDDGPGQTPLDQSDVESAILSLLPDRKYDLIITHSVEGEYTRHLRHEEVGSAVAHLITSDRLQTAELWMFAYEDGNREYLPRAIENSDRVTLLPENIRSRKHQIITQTYGFPIDGWEARTTPAREAFWVFNSINDLQNRVVKGRIQK